MEVQSYKNLRNISHKLSDIKNELFKSSEHLNNMETLEEFYAVDDMMCKIIKEIDALNNFLALRS